MKRNYFLLLVFITLTISCGKGKNEFEQEQAQIEQNNLDKEKERIHLEKIEVGKSKLKIYLENEVDRLNKLLEQEEIKLNEINAFQIGRSSDTKEIQLIEQNRKISSLTTNISKIQNEIALSNLRETYEFQDTPVGVVNYLFEAARSWDFSKLRNLCDPYGENDGDARAMCLVEMQPRDIQSQFVENFKNARIMGEPKIFGDSAEIEIATGSSSNYLQKIQLINRMGKWYFKSF